jgi:biotin operon repressor
MRTHDRLARITDWLRRAITEADPALQPELGELLQHTNQVREHALTIAGQGDLFNDPGVQRLVALAQLRRAIHRSVEVGARHRATSMAAASGPNRATQRERVVRLLMRHGPLCDEDIASHLGMLRSSASARRNNLYEDGIVVDSGLRAKGGTGAQVVLWAIDPDLVRALGQQAPPPTQVEAPL